MSTQTIAFPRVSEIQDFFFDASLATYAGDTPKTTIPDLPGSKHYHFERGDLIYDDVYFTNGESSGGSTVICLRAEPKPRTLWLMQYQGWCEGDNPEVLAFLKDALRYAYEHRSFCGGRGERRYPVTSTRHKISGGITLEYFNEGNEADGPIHSLGQSPFHKFSGEECITRLPTRLGGPNKIFWHRYQGLLLIPYHGM
ncbi:MAG: hypothetical protein WCF77_02560 [Minisyncoccia bacterium]